MVQPHSLQDLTPPKAEQYTVIENPESLKSFELRPMVRSDQQLSQKSSDKGVDNATYNKRKKERATMANMYMEIKENEEKKEEDVTQLI